MQSAITKIILVAGLALALAAPVAAAPLASVVSAQGTVQAEGPDGRRDLAPGATLAAGERVVTGADGRLGLAAGDVWVQLEPGAQLGLATAAGAPKFELSRGSARLVDGRAASAAPLALVTPHARLTASGIDADVKVGATDSRICQSDGRVWLEVAGATREFANGCLTSTAVGAAPAVAAFAGHSISIDGPVVAVAVTDLFLPGVAAPPPGTIGLMPFDPDWRTYGPCDDPGSGCLAIRPAPFGGRGPASAPSNGNGRTFPGFDGPGSGNPGPSTP
jgi:hypothetical protein